MRIETMLNKCQKFKSFVYKNVKLVGVEHDNKHLEVNIEPRKNAHAVCSCCHRQARLYDRLSVRYFEFVPMWGYRVFFIYKMRRVNCKTCGIKVEEVPWASGKYTLLPPC